MSINAQRSVVVIFDGRTEAEDAIEALQNAGLSPDQIYYSGTEGTPKTSFWKGITRLFAHREATTGDPLAPHLKALGFSDDEISRYVTAHRDGRFVVAVKAPDRADEALAILRANGAHD
jgi:hypothetical protein